MRLNRENNDPAFALGYKAGSYANAVYGVVNLASGLKQITTSNGSVIVNSTGEVTRVISGTLEGVEKAIKGFVISAISTVNGVSTPKGGSAPEHKHGFNRNGEMLGKNGTRVDSETKWQDGKTKELMLRIQNRGKGQAMFIIMTLIMLNTDLIP